MPKLSVTVIARNEASCLAEALTSAAWADEIVVVDAESTDDTVAIARQHAHTVVVRPWTGYGDQKNHAASVASHDWILSLDADERITPALAREIAALLRHEPPARGYAIPRVTRHLGRWLRSTDWYPDHQLRLYDRRTARWNGRHVHEGVNVTGPVARLSGELEHMPYRDIADHLETIDRYTGAAARQMYESGERATFVRLAGHPPLAFLRNYFWRRGFRDGIPGLVVSAMNSYYVLLKYAKLWELDRKNQNLEP